MKSLPSWRPYDPAYTLCKLTLTGLTSLLMSSAETDRRGELYISYRALSKKRNKTIEDEERLRELEWYTRLYYDEQIGPFIPSRNVKELLRQAATAWKDGENVTRGLVIMESRIPLRYKGPREAAALWNANYYYPSMVKNAGPGGGRVERTRPCFDDWSLTFNFAFDPQELDLTRVEEIIGRTPKYGLGDYRPEFGAFTPTFEVVETKRGNAKVNGSKAKDSVRDRALKAHAKQLTGQ